MRFRAAWLLLLGALAAPAAAEEPDLFEEGGEPRHMAIGPVPAGALSLGVRYTPSYGGMVRLAAELGAGETFIPQLFGVDSVLGELDLVQFEVASTGLAFVVTHCGEVYPDQLSAQGTGGTLYLSDGQEGIIPVGTLGAPNWVVHHVKSWHRAGREGSCREPGAWTQLAAWR